MSNKYVEMVFDMAEPKPLPPSMRAPKRYIAFEVISESPIEYGDLVATLWNSMLDFLGEVVTSKTGMWIIQNLYSKENQRGVIRCRREFVEEIRTALSLIHTIGERKVTIKILGVTGTIKSAKNKYLTEKSIINYSKP